ncbi:MAG: hypothetical protein ACO1SV_16300 [Fimbriimonas sp.]
MEQQVIHMPDIAGAGQVLERPFIRVVFQSGFPKEVGINGCRVEDVIEVALERLLRYQQGPLACEENAAAIRHLEQAREDLELRKRRRQEQGVLNTMSQHETIRTEDEDEDFSATGS